MNTCRKSSQKGAVPKTPAKTVKEKKQVSIEDGKSKKNSWKGRKCTVDGSKDDKKLYIPRRIFARKTKPKRLKKNVLPMNFGPLVDCT